MKIGRTQSATRNMVFGWLLQVYNLILPFIVRTAMIYIMGVQYLGLNSLFISIISVLNLAELGIGNAMVFSMYKPIAEDDHDKICKLMNLYRLYYRVIGLVVGVLGMAVVPFLSNLIKSDIPSGVNIYVLYFLNLGATVCTYWMFAYKSSLLYAYQKSHVESKLNIIISTIKTAVQLAVLYFTRNYYTYLILAIVFQIITNVAISVITARLFPQCQPRGKLEKSEVKEINCRIRDLFTSKLGMVFINQVDTIVISAFLGLTMLAIYQNYFYILTSVRGVITVALHACVAGIGNSIIVETKEKNLKDLGKLTFIVSWFSGFGACCFLCLYQPFMKIWMGEALMLEFSAIICFCVYFFVLEINQLLSVYKEAGGLWHEDRFRPLVTAAVNLTLNLITVRFWGIYGIILSTVVTTLFIGMPWLLNNLFTVLFERKDLAPYLKKLMGYVGVSVIAACATLALCNLFRLGDWSTLIVRAIICFIVPNVIFLAVYFRKREFCEAVSLLDAMTKGKFGISRVVNRLNEKYAK